MNGNNKNESKKSGNEKTGNSSKDKNTAENDPFSNSAAFSSADTTSKDASSNIQGETAVPDNVIQLPDDIFDANESEITLPFVPFEPIEDPSSKAASTPVESRNDTAESTDSFVYDENETPILRP